MTLTAKLWERVLTVSGVAASTSSQVRIWASDLRVEDNGPVRVVVPVDNDGSIVKTIDARGLAGAGASIDTFDTYVTAVFGSEQNDTISFYGHIGSVYGGGGADTITGRGRAATLSGGLGDDTLIADYRGSGGATTLSGGSGHDNLRGDSGNNTLIGGRGNDKLNGGDGFDVAVYSGTKADYDLSIVHGALVLKDLRRGTHDGTDTINNVEQLKFADGVLDNLPVATELSATLSEQVLIVSGVAASTSPRVGISASELRVTDNGPVTVLVPVDNDGSMIKKIDARGLEGAGASIVTVNSNVTAVFGSEQDDYISFSGTGGSVFGGAGADIIFCRGNATKLRGGSGDDILIADYSWVGPVKRTATLDGGPGDDTLRGDNDNDLLIGGRGSDKLDGGAGSDVAFYSGNRADYDLRIVEQTYVLKDLRRNSPDGTDTIIGVEQLKFADSVLDLTSLATLAHTSL